MIKTFHEHDRTAQTPARPQPLFAGAVRPQQEEQPDATTLRLRATLSGDWSDAALARIVRQYQQLDGQNAAELLQVGHDQAQQLNHLIEEASHIMLHPMLAQLRQYIRQVMQALEQFAAPYQRKAGWLNRWLGQDTAPVLSQAHYLSTKARLQRLLEGIRPLVLQLPKLQQRVTELQQHSVRVQQLLEELAAALSVYLQDHPDDGSDARLNTVSRRLAVLRTLAESAGLQQRQMQLSAEQLHQLHAQLAEVEQVVFPLWQQQALVLLGQQDQRQGLQDLLHIQSQLMGRLNHTLLQQS